MYKITVFFQSFIESVYVKEEETAHTNEYCDDVRYRMLNKWLSILCPHIDYDALKCSHPMFLNVNKELEEQYKLDLINLTLKYMDNIDYTYAIGDKPKPKAKRSFTFTVEEIN